MDEASDGDLRALVRFFARIEEKALRAELQAPLTPVPESAGAVAVARAYAARLKAREVENQELKAQKATELADALHGRLTLFMENTAHQVQEAFREFDFSAFASIHNATPPDPRAKYWHGQLVHAARLADFYANLSEGSWWVRLHLRLRGNLLRFIATIQKVGRGETGVLALTVFAEALSFDSENGPPTPLYRVFEHPHVPESVTLIYTDDAETRWEDVHQVVDTALSTAISRFSEDLA